MALLVDARTWKEDAVDLVMEMMRRLRDEDALDARRLYMLAPRSKRAKRLVRKEMAKQPSFHVGLQRYPFHPRVFITGARFFFYIHFNYSCY